MGKRLDLDKIEIAEILGNGLELTLTLDSDDAINIRFASQEGGRQIGVKPHDEEPNTLVVYLKPDANRGFRVI